MQDFRMETFLQVCKYMNYTKAAEALSITQPAVSQHIRFLEESYGAPLFLREGKRIRLTRAGAMLRDMASRLKNDEAHFRKLIRAAGRQREYSFGATLSAAEFMLADGLERLLARPDLRIRLQVDNTKRLLEELEEGRIDFALVEGDFPRQRYACHLFRREPFIPVAAPDLAERYRGRAMADLAAERLIVREPGSGSREIQVNALRSAGLTLADFPDRTELANIGLIKELLVRGQGVSFMYRVAAEREMAEGRLAPVELKGFALEHDVMFIYRKDTLFEEEFRKIFSILREGGADTE